MSNYNNLKTSIDANIKQNGNQEITGPILNSVLNQMVNILGTGYQFAGVATLDPATEPGTPDAKVFYIANGKGTYTNFGGIEVTEDDVVVLYWDTAWHKVATGIASQAKLSELESETRVSLTPYTDNYAMVNESGVISKRDDCVISDFIEVSENDTLTWSSGIGHKEAFVYLAQYDADKNITSSIWVSFPSVREIPVREGTKYVRASFKKSSDAYLKDGKGNYLFSYNDVSNAIRDINSRVSQIEPFFEGNKEIEWQHLNQYVKTGDIGKKFDIEFINSSTGINSSIVAVSEGDAIYVTTGGMVSNLMILDKDSILLYSTEAKSDVMSIKVDCPSNAVRAIVQGYEKAKKVSTNATINHSLDNLSNETESLRKETESLGKGQVISEYTDNYAMVSESGVISKRDGCVISDFIEVSENDTLTWSSDIILISGVVRPVYLAQYDADKNITSSVWASLTSVREIPIREGTKYVRASFKKSSNAYLKDSKGNYLFAYNDISKALQNIEITTDAEHEILPSSYAEEVGYRTSQQYVNLRWTPKFPVPMQGGANYFPANEERKGILYAEGAYQDKRVGYDVSLKTFMTAINNPYSLMYTENCAAQYSKSAYGVQYKGDANSGAYMGFVCNNFVFHTLGEKIPYSSVEIATWCVEKGLTEKIYDQSSHGLKLMDILQIDGHCRVVTRLWANSRNVVTKVQVSEAVGSGSTNVIYTAEQFDKWLKSSGYAIYRYRDLYKNIYYEKSPFVAVEDEVAEPYEYNNDICTFAGDYASFGEGSLLHINYTKGNYNIMEIYKNDILIESIVLSSDENTHDVDLTNKGYTYGKYKARLTNGTEHSDYTYFEILNVELSKNGNLFTFSSANAKPIYWGWFAMNGWAFQKHILTESDLAKGSVDYSQYQTSDGHPYLKIYVQGEYGRTAKIVG